MANIIWMFGILCAIHDSHTSLPYLEDVKARTRLCLGEGSHCPVNLPFSSCCKPYVCTEVPQTRKPTLIFKFTHYKDHRCLLPSSKLKPVTKYPTLNHGNFNGTNPNLQEHEYFYTKTSPIGENTTIEITNSINDANETYSSSSNSNPEEYDENYKNALPLSNETYLYTDRNETGSSYIIKRTNSSYNQNKTSNFEQGYLYVDDEVDNNNTSQIESGSSSFENANFTSSILSSESDNYNSSENKYREMRGNSSNKYIDKLKELNLNSTLFEKGTIAEDKYPENITTVDSITKISPKTFTNNSDVTEEEWTSSDMTYDTRAGLHKVVTIQPFRLFQSVELLKLNESIETSD